MATLSALGSIYAFWLFRTFRISGSLTPDLQFILIQIDNELQQVKEENAYTV